MTKSKDSPSFNQYLETVFKVIAIVGALIAAYTAINEMREGRKQRAEDLRWRQANAAKSLIDQMDKDAQAGSAEFMIDWDGRNYRVNDSVVYHILYEDVVRALR